MHRERETKLSSKVAITLVIALFSATTVAAAITASSRDPAHLPKIWQQQQPSILMKLPGSFGPQDPLF